MPVPLLGRLRWAEWRRIALAALILLAESILRFALMICPPLKLLIDTDKKSRKEEDDECCTFTGMAKKHEFRVEEHSLVTKEGFVLVLHRLRKKSSLTRSGSNSSLNGTNADRKLPILCMHGLMMTSEVWIVGRDPNSTIGFSLCEAG